MIQVHKLVCENIWDACVWEYDWNEMDSDRAQA
jgi:hypothetical protein